ncbi:cellulase family glycosylhydrolase [Mycolicibacterium confluentis]|uniref:cellulase family glycosylhydrolase n=1 Tax=Mycolicibacterium confluentis TaxID=28047 RepID=UPI0010564F84|nr:cellulase family glycosylhydrolase [Mycolicibacterium confluentis]
MNRPSLLHRVARRTVAVGAAAAMLSVAAASHGPVLVSAVTPKQVGIPFLLTGVSTTQTGAGIVQSPSTLGVADSDLYTMSDAEIDKTLTKLAELGVTDIRVAVPWVYMEKRNDQYDWTKMDYVVQTANAKGINVVGVITATPTWAGFPLNGHSDPQEYAEFAGAVADRYDGVVDTDAHGDQTHGKISAYEIWNEPNGALFYNPVSASSYTAMLKAASPMIRDADPDAVVIAGVLGSVITIPGLSQNPVSFFREMYENGAADYFDALSYHPYNPTMPFSQGAGLANSPLNQVNALRALMVQYEGEGTTKKIWITEYGVPTNGPVTEQHQADFIRDLVVAWQNVEGAGPIFIYSTRDINSGGFDDEENFGIFYSDWDEKKVVQTIRDLYADFADDGELTPFQAAIPKISDFQQLLMLGRQLISFLLIVPRAVVQFAVSAVTALVRAVVDTVGSALGLTRKSVAAATGAAIDERAASVATDPHDETSRQGRDFVRLARESARELVEPHRGSIEGSSDADQSVTDAQLGQSAVEVGQLAVDLTPVGDNEGQSGVDLKPAAEAGGDGGQAVDLKPAAEAGGDGGQAVDHKPGPEAEAKPDFRQVLKQRRADLRDQIKDRVLLAQRGPAGAGGGRGNGTDTADPGSASSLVETPTDQANSAGPATADSGQAADPD